MNYYDILKVSPEATEEEVKKAYLELARIYHPDVYQGDKKYAEEQMKKLNEAYAVLKSSSKRAIYDFDLKHQVQDEVERSYTTRKSQATNGQNEAVKQKRQKHTQTYGGAYQHRASPTQRKKYEMPFYLSWPFIIIGLYISSIYDKQIAMYLLWGLIGIRLAGSLIYRELSSSMGKIIVLFLICCVLHLYPDNWKLFDSTRIAISNLFSVNVIEDESIEDERAEDIENKTEDTTNMRLYENAYPVYIFVKYVKDDYLETDAGVNICVDGQEIYQCSEQGLYPLAMVLSVGNHVLSIKDRNSFDRKYSFYVGESNVLGDVDVYITMQVEHSADTLNLINPTNVNQINAGTVSQQEIEELYLHLQNQLKKKYICIGDFEEELKN